MSGEAPINSTQLPDKTVVDRYQAALLVGVSPTHVATLARQGKLARDADGNYTVGALRAFDETRGAPVGQPSGEGKWYEVQLTPDQVGALTEAGYAVRDPREKAKQREATAAKKAAKKLAEMGVEL